MNPKTTQRLRDKGGNIETTNERPAGEILQHGKSDINISEALRASGEKLRNTIRNFILDLREEALVA